MAYRTNAEQLTYLAAQIVRLETTITRAEQMGLGQSAAGGITRTFTDLSVLSKRLARAKARYSELQSIIAGEPMEAGVRYAVISSE